MRGTVSWWHAAPPRGAHDSLIADEMWERLRDEYVFRCKITTCACQRVRFEISWINRIHSPHVCNLRGVIRLLQQQAISESRRTCTNVPPIRKLLPFRLRCFLDLRRFRPFIVSSYMGSLYVVNTPPRQQSQSRECNTCPWILGRDAQKGSYLWAVRKT